MKNWSGNSVKVPWLFLALGITCMCMIATAVAQPIAKFGRYPLNPPPLSPEKVEGCIPDMIIQFIDSSTINGNPVPHVTSPYNSHTWDFDDGSQPSHIKNPVKGFFLPRVYNVTLTVRDAQGNTASTTRTITVFERPVIDIVAVPSVGCDPLQVCFINNSYSPTPGDSVVETIYEFQPGDIRAVQGTGQICWTYNLTPQKCYNVTVIVRTARGCTNNRTFTNMVCLYDYPTADFTVDRTEFCSPPYTASFTNTSSSPSNNALIYKWYFGDGDSSTAANPVHTYTKDSVYTVTLQVTDAVCGYTTSVMKTDLITASEAEAYFITTQPVVCDNAPAQFIDSSTGSPLTYLWDFGDGSNPSTAKNPSHTFSLPPGSSTTTFNVTLVVTNSIGCKDTFTRQHAVTVNPRPTGDFSGTPTTSCLAPLDVSFTSTVSPDVISYNWSFGETTPNPTYTFLTSGNKNVSLELTNNFGCTRTITKNNYIRIQPLTVCYNFQPATGCVPLTVTFTDCSQSIPPGTIYYWDFGDTLSGPDNTSNLKDATHIFNTPGVFQVTHSILTPGGCTGSITKQIRVGAPLTPAFAVDKTTVCVNEDVTFTNLTDTTGFGNVISWSWNYCNGTSSSFEPPPNSWDEPGQCEITLRAGFNGCFGDTSFTITILDPKAEFDFTQTCANPFQVQFNDLSEGAQVWEWDFGDFSTSTQQHPLHAYADTGTYEVTLVVKNLTTGCENEMKKTVTIEFINAQFDVNKYEACVGEVLTFQNQSTGTGNFLWTFANGQTSPLPNPTYAYTTPGIKTVSLLMTNPNNGCTDTEVKTAFITVYSVTADFSVDSRNSCYDAGGSTFCFSDLSTSTPVGSNVNSWNWSFGATTQNACHTYSTAGNKNVTLTVTNDKGCSDSETKNNYISVRDPSACFTTDFSVYCLNQPVKFTNCGSTTGVRLCWDFGDGTAMVCGVSNPTHSYTALGTYDVTLIVEDQISPGCNDTLVVQDAITIADPDIKILADNVTDDCPPHLVNFTDSSSFNGLAVKSIFWEFGDGGTSTKPNPSHIYNKAGCFTVKVHVTFANQCIDSITETRYICIGGATGDITAEPDTGCSPLNVVLNANSEGAISHYWIPDIPGYDRAGTDTFHMLYTPPDCYTPAVVLTDTQSPPCSYVLYADFEVLVDTVYPAFSTDANIVCMQDPVQFTDSSSTLKSNIVRWHWDFDYGDISNLQHPVHYFTRTGNHTVTLTAYSSLGCESMLTKNIFVRDKPTAVFTVSDTAGCDSLLVNFTEASFPGADAPINRWFWNFGDPNVLADTSILQNPPGYFYRDTGHYNPYLVVTDLNGCDDTATASINVYQTPDGILMPDTLVICQGDTVQLFSDSSSTSLIYRWSPANVLSATNISNPFASPSDSTDIFLEVEQNGCIRYDTMRINVVPLPPLTVSPYPDTAVCVGDTVQLNAYGGTNIVWSPGNFGLSDDSIPNPILAASRTIKWIATLHGEAGCQSKDSVTVIVNVITPDFIGEENCLGDTTDFISLTRTTDLPITSWQWNFGDPNSANNTSLQRNPRHFYADSGHYNVQLVVTDNIGCTDTVQKTVIVSAPATAVAYADTGICLGASVQLFSSGGEKIYWTPDYFISSTDSFNPVVTPDVTTTYIAHITNGVCPWDTAAVTVIVAPPPVIRTIENTTIVRGTEIALETFVDRYDSISWSPPTYLSCTNCLSPVSMPDQKVTYTVKVIDQYGCENTAQVTIDVSVECKDEQLFVASAFTPDGDGINDQVYARLYGLEKLNSFKVYDRWGKLLFVSEDPNIGWDGTDLDGEKLNGGVYVYVAEAVCFFKRVIQRTGNITLIK